MFSPQACAFVTQDPLRICHNDYPSPLHAKATLPWLSWIITVRIWRGSWWGVPQTCSPHRFLGLTLVHTQSPAAEIPHQESRSQQRSPEHGVGVCPAISALWRDEGKSAVLRLIEERTLKSLYARAEIGRPVLDFPFSRYLSPSRALPSASHRLRVSRTWFRYATEWQLTRVLVSHCGARPATAVKPWRSSRTQTKAVSRKQGWPRTEHLPCMPKKGDHCLFKKRFLTGLEAPSDWFRRVGVPKHRRPHTSPSPRRSELRVCLQAPRRSRTRPACQGGHRARQRGSVPERARDLKWRRPVVFLTFRMLRTLWPNSCLLPPTNRWH